MRDRRGFAWVWLSLSLLGWGVGCSTPPASTSVAQPGHPVQAAVQTVEEAKVTGEVQAEGLSCPMCAVNIEKQLTRVPGVRSASLDLSRGVVVMTIDPAQPPSEASVRQAVEDAGFTVVEVRLPAGQGGEP